ncbi:type III pantothenate kinase [Algoriphagus halophytocola]|uniref:Type III pantothenate kinase n=1 Tax=Algoriphagus halophytocola TaxID=2991499 RepID=A0ABY6MC85_9BACT|nr:MULTISPECIES: type III pantothenate kinase [unclassified Algoriphagus]UZD21291.1 type III pantothenate kinase [Algoriphagus sp. TR-M5]WBL42502.1 type III pantothenate kinase [Algoriphagus sp. TR-M9]
MFLAIDAGNSNVVFAIYDEEKGQWKNHFRLETHSAKFSAQLAKKAPLYFLEHGISPQDILQVGLSSVVPELNPQLIEFCQNFFGTEPYLITPKSFAKLPVKTLRPDEIGTDLMCNAAAAYTAKQTDLIVVDFGTALTFTVINKNGEIIGVNIVPGLKTAIKSLFLNTSKLPEVELKLPESALGKNTIQAIQAGVLYGYTGLVKGMLESIALETKIDYTVIATGGLASILTPLKSVFDEIDPNLTLTGLRLITQVNN